MYIHNMYIRMYIKFCYCNVYFNNAPLIPRRSRMYHLYELRTKLLNECERAIYLSQSSIDQPSHRRPSTHTLAVVARRQPTVVEKLPSIQSQGSNSINTTSVDGSPSGYSRSVLESPASHRTTLESPVSHRTTLESPVSLRTTLESPAKHRATLESVLRKVDIHKILGSVSKQVWHEPCSDMSSHGHLCKYVCTVCT